VSIVLHRWRLAAAAALLLIVVFGTVYYRRFGDFLTPAQLAAGLPVPRGVYFFLDADGLRRSGILQLLSGPKVVEEPEYRSFVERTGFDYRRDLESVLASFHGDDMLVYIQGRFDYDALADYATAQGGGCSNGICRIAASRENRHISFRQLRRNLLALAVSTDPMAVNRLGLPGSPTIPVPSQPVWMTISEQALRDPDAWPPPARILVKALAGTQEVTIALGSNGGQLEMTLDASCLSEERAAVIAADLDQTTVALRRKLEGKADPRELTTVLAGGRFERRGRRVAGTWPIERAFLASLAGGSL
jgi:hypothetical protein